MKHIALEFVNMAANPNKHAPSQTQYNKLIYQYQLYATQTTIVIAPYLLGCVAQVVRLRATPILQYPQRVTKILLSTTPTLRIHFQDSATLAIHQLSQRIPYQKQVQSIAKQQPSQPKHKPFDYVAYVNKYTKVEEVIQLKAVFDLFDEDMTALINLRDLQAEFEKLGFKEQNNTIYDIIGQLDEEYSGEIDFAQFVELATKKPSRKDSRKQVNQIFMLFDKNNNGQITWDELKQIMNDAGDEMSDQEIQALFKRADKDNDGFVTSDDFYNIMTGKVYWD